MNEGTEVTRYIQKNKWDLEFDGRIAENIFGTNYDVTFACTNGYADLSSVRYGTKEIIIKQPCQMQQDIFGHNPGVEYASYMLAHELGHTETYGVGTGVGCIILALGIKKAIQEREIKFFAGATSAALIAKFSIDELLANISAQWIHQASITTNTPQWYQTLLDLL